jgi:hypothetical protein
VFSLAGSSATFAAPLRGKDGLPPVRAALVQGAAVFVFGGTIAAAYATIVSGMGALSGNQWAQLWAVMWLLYLVRVPGEPYDTQPLKCSLYYPTSAGRRIFLALIWSHCFTCIDELTFPLRPSIQQCVLFSLRQ